MPPKKQSKRSSPTSRATTEPNNSQQTIDKQADAGQYIAPIDMKNMLVVAHKLVKYEKTETDDEKAAALDGLYQPF